MGSLFEVQTQLIIANELQFLSNEDIYGNHSTTRKRSKNDK
jgi:hypothetical protein